MDCGWPPPPANETGMDGCYPVNDTKYYVDNYYKIKGED